MALGKNKFKIVLDTNVYISALLFGGVPEEIMEMVRNKEVVLYASPAILLELARILNEKFRFNKKMTIDVVSEIKRIGNIVYPKMKLDVIVNDSDDNVILECGVECRAHYIVTGDKKHLRPIKEYKGIKIVLPAEFIKGLK